MPPPLKMAATAWDVLALEVGHFSGAYLLG